jgi:Spy/CpxP family protein refolding chaperone
MEDALGSHGSQGRWWNDPALIEKLKLTDDQRKQMDGIMLQHRETLVDMRANVEKAELGMEPLMSDDQPNETKILAQIDKVAQARAELEKANARFLLAIRGKLTPDQWKALRAARSERMQRRGWQSGQRQGKPGGDRQGRPDRQGPPPQGGGAPGPAGVGAGPDPGPQGMLDDEMAPEPDSILPTASDQ